MGPRHSHHVIEGRSPAAPGFSLLRLSAFTRVSGAFALVAAVWAAVYWALH
jgi:hypothetical protein